MAGARGPPVCGNAGFHPPGHFLWPPPSPTNFPASSNRSAGRPASPKPTCSDMLREVRMALLEADVALPVVRDFIARVKEKALGQEVMGSLKPGPGAGGHRQPRTGRHHGRGRLRHQPRRPAAGRDPDGRPAGRRQDHHHRQAGQAPDRKAQEEGADGLRRRLPPGRHRAAQDRDGAGRRRVVPQHARPEAARHRRWPRSITPASTTSTCCWSTPPAAWPSTKR